MTYTENEKEFLIYVIKTELLLDKAQKDAAYHRLLEENDHLDNVTLANSVLGKHNIINHSEKEYPVNIETTIKDTWSKYVKPRIKEKDWNLNGEEIKNWKAFKAFLRKDLYPKWLRSNLEPKQLWLKLFEQISSLDKLSIQPLGIQMADVRLPSKERGLPEYPLKTRVRCHLQLERSSYVILLSKFTSGAIVCVCPSYLVFKNYHPSGEFICPDPKHETDPYFELDGNLGVEEWIAIASNQKLTLGWLPQEDSQLPKQDLMELSSVQLNDLLDYVKAQKCEVMGFKYQITA